MSEQKQVEQKPVEKTNRKTFKEKVQNLREHPTVIFLSMLFGAIFGLAAFIFAIGYFVYYMVTLNEDTKRRQYEYGYTKDPLQNNHPPQSPLPDFRIPSG